MLRITQYLLFGIPFLIGLTLISMDPLLLQRVFESGVIVYGLMLVLMGLSSPSMFTT